jgi:hypothetical protein
MARTKVKGLKSFTVRVKDSRTVKAMKRIAVETGQPMPAVIDGILDKWTKWLLIEAAKSAADRPAPSTFLGDALAALTTKVV